MPPLPFFTQPLVPPSPIRMLPKTSSGSFGRCVPMPMPTNPLASMTILVLEYLAPTDVVSNIIRVPLAVGVQSSAASNVI